MYTHKTILLCVTIACRKLDEPQGGTVVYSNNQDIDSVATYLCNESSQIMGSVMCNASILGWNRTGKTCGELINIMYL